jgi:hypothetical protein
VHDVDPPAASEAETQEKPATPTSDSVTVPSLVSSTVYRSSSPVSVSPFSLPSTTTVVTAEESVATTGTSVVAATGAAVTGPTTDVPVADAVCVTVPRSASARVSVYVPEHVRTSSGARVSGAHDRNGSAVTTSDTFTVPVLVAPIV